MAGRPPDSARGYLIRDAGHVTQNTADFHPRGKEEKPGLNSPSSLRQACGIWPAIIKQEGRTIVLWWWLIAGVAFWLCSGALIPLGWALSVAIGRWRRETSAEHAAVVQDVAAE
jgi:hypothetical protein